MRYTRNLFRKFRGVAESLEACLPAARFRVLAPFLVVMGVLTVIAVVLAVIYERMSLFPLL